jgi:hypothetical protein
MLLVVLVSQPSVPALLLQLPQPELQTIAQALPLQLAMPLALLQTEPQPPQFVTLVVVLVSQPFG